jgi:hypothetical protein
MVRDRAARLTILGHDSQGNTSPDEDEYHLENMCHHLALLHITLWDTHLVPTT